MLRIPVLLLFCVGFSFGIFADSSNEIDYDFPNFKDDALREGEESSVNEDVSDDRGDYYEDYNYDEDSEIEEDERDKFARLLNSVSSIKEFNDKYVNDRVSFDNKYGSEEGIGELGKCAVAPAQVEVPRDTNYLHQKCVTISQCSGCCNNNRFSCNHTDSREILVAIPLYKFGNDGKPYLETTMKKKFMEHLKCQCMCKLTPADCHEKQTFNSKNCSCECKGRHLNLLKRKCKKQHNRWNGTTCECTRNDIRRNARW